MTQEAELQAHADNFPGLDLTQPLADNDDVVTA